MGFYIRAYLSKLLDVSYETREVDGVPQECIIIPLHKNGLKKDPRTGSVGFSLGMYERRPNAWGHTHYISWLLPEGLYAQYKDLGLTERFTLFGHAKLSARKSERKYGGTQKTIDEILSE